jgi:hypothetical protein
LCVCVCACVCLCVWMCICVCAQISPATHPKALVRIDLESGSSIKFEVRRP